MESGITPKIILDGINHRLQTLISKEIMEAVIKDIMNAAQPFIKAEVERIAVEGIEMGRDLMKMRDDYHVTYSLGEQK